MRATRSTRLRKLGVSSLVGALTAATCLVFSAPAASAAPATIVNNGTSSGPGAVPNWLESNTISSTDLGLGSNTVQGNLVVQHDPGLTVTGLAIDSDWGATDETATVAPTALSGAITDSEVAGGASNYSTVHFSYAPPTIGGLRGGTLILCLLSGADQASGPQRVRAVLSDGSRTPVVSATIQDVQSVDCGGATDFPSIFGTQQSATSVAPGASVTFQLKGFDPDTSGSDNNFDKYRWRVRRLNDGAIVQGPNCVDIAGAANENLNQTFPVTFNNGRGRYVVETEAGGESDTCPTGNFSNNAHWWRVGAVDVNTAPTLSLAGAPASVQAGTGYTVTATAADADTNGRVQAIDWDADGNATNGPLSNGFERRVTADEPTGVTTADKTQAVTTAVGQCADRTVRAHIVDNGAMNGSDPSAGQQTVSATTVVNCAPVANDQTVTGIEDTPAPFTIAPTDGDSDTLTYTVIDAPDHGSLSGTFAASPPNSPSSLSYVPDADFNGTDSYTYKVDDGHGASDTATVTFNVAAVNDTPIGDDVTVHTDEDTTKVIDLSALVHDVDVATNGQHLTVSVTTDPDHGTATATGDTEITYVPSPDNFNGTASFVYTVDDGSGTANSSDTGVITVVVDPVDDAPVAANQDVTTLEDHAVTVNLGPSTDVDGEDVTYSVVTQPANGHVDISGTNATYTPNLNTNGDDPFVFQAADAVNTPQGTVTVHVTPVNDAPVAAAQSVVTDEDTPLPITLTASDVDNLPSELVYTVVSPPSHGQLDTTSGASLTYSPDLNYNGPDSLTFQVADPDGAVTTASVTITVNPVNDAPVADDQSLSTAEDDPLPILLTASDVDNTQDQLSYTVTVAPQFGTLSGTDKDLVYTPNLNYDGPDAFDFQVSDGAAIDTGHVDITVTATNDPPSAIPQVVSTGEDTPLGITLDATDPDDATTDLTFAVTAGPSHGTLSGTAPVLTYTPDLDFNGFDAFVFTATDPSGASDTATVVIGVGEVGTNDNPVANDGSITTDEDTDGATVLSATDVDGDDLTYSVSIAPAHGTAAILNDVLIYSPELNYNGTDQVTFRVDDPNGGFNFATVDITVTSVNDAPDAIPQTVELLEDTPTHITLTGTDVESDPLSFAITSPPSHGSLAGTAPNVVYTPTLDYNGNDSFDFTVSDGNGGTTTGTISLIVDPAPKTVTKMFAEGVVLSLVKTNKLLLISVPLTAHLTDAATGAGIPGKTVLFTAGTGTLTYSCTAVTDSHGEAVCDDLISTVSGALNLGYTAYFAGDADNLASSDNGPLISLFGLHIL